MNSSKPYLIDGGRYIDDRGNIQFFNDGLDFSVRRIYMTENFDKSVIRGWHGHRETSKIVYVVSGSFLIYLIKMDDHLEIHKYFLNEYQNQLLYIPKGFYNAFKVLENKSKILFLNDSVDLKDDERLEIKYFESKVYNINWETINR